MKGVACEFCDDPIKPSERGIYRLVSGWTDNRGGGKTVTISLFSKPLAFAHKECVSLAMKITHAQQDTLFDANE